VEDFDAELETYSGETSLKELWLNDTHLSDKGMTQLRALKNLER
jgi:hypothetical protein